MFPSNTYLRVIKALNIVIAQVQSVHDALATAEADPLLEAEVLSLLDQIEAVEAALFAERSSPNSAMTRADVVEWQPGKRTEGMTTALNVLKHQLANLLGVTWNNLKPGSLGTQSISTQTIL